MRRRAQLYIITMLDASALVVPGPSLPPGPGDVRRRSAAAAGSSLARPELPNAG
ncbi:MAG: hypothetical protein AVDCRST_MAG39-409 [uncultured Sphingomonadaceae bacterium]|uniref:Uncharacterized protein n=1 Tax=uncultured Sphingomonadaceae bacterium TaxID=169976 RepID=A0A6J4S269_9SPHN|nr:MAG: hypothetical protein AVDCRST_MAG39-409 [uncultured Sphingomonadaceae bacterium]